MDIIRLCCNYNFILYSLKYFTLMESGHQVIHLHFFSCPFQLVDSISLFDNRWNNNLVHKLGVRKIISTKAYIILCIYHNVQMR